MSTPGEFDVLVKELKDIYTHLATNRRHLIRIEIRAERLKAQIEALLPEVPPSSEEVPVEVHDGLEVLKKELDEESEEEEAEPDEGDEVPREVV